MVCVIKNSNGRKFYIRGRGKFYYLSSDKKGALDNVPDGWQVVKSPNGRIYLRRKN